ncbi:MAG: cbb3-type cytochrome oxidase assembly protein CcoS [Bdellovibrionaceae bacterium]|nr:cbb3-type cytochrome oxidase assembly protein CcoS [Pseudobdellovibrionaceae bacterium]
MSIILIMIPASLLLGLFFLGAFIWATKEGQFDDLVTPQYEILIEDKQIKDVKHE